MIREKSEHDQVVVMEQLLEFEVAFPGEQQLTIEQYLSGVSRSTILNSATFFLGFKNHKSKYKDNSEFLGMFFRQENIELAKQVYDKIKSLENTGVRVGIINPYSSLQLFEYYFSKPEEEETQTEAEVEVNLFKAYLVLNSEFTKKQRIAFPSAKESDEGLNFAMMLFCPHYPISDKLNYDLRQVWITQTIKSIYLFQFLEIYPKTQPLLAAFLAYFNCSTWQEYLKRLLPLTKSAIDSDREAHTDIVIEQGDEFEQNCRFIEKQIIQDNDELDQNDFLTTRAKPFYKVKDGVYRIIFNLFVVEKIFKGIYFLLRDINKTMPKSTQIPAIKSVYGDEFSEKILCYKVIESIYINKCIKFSGQELTDLKIDAAPDYYIRKDKNIMVFESKDFLVAADKKMSFDFNVYEEEFGRILDYEELPGGKIKPKAVMQLVNSIRRLLKNDFVADSNYNHKDVFIYPVLLTHDLQYDVPGFNELIDFWFQDALLELQDEGLYIHKIKPLSVVNIDSIIYNQFGLCNKIPFHKMLDQYHLNKRVPRQKKRNYRSQEEFDRYLYKYKQMRMAKLIPFSQFINRFFHDHGLSKVPQLIELVAPALFKEEYLNQPT